MSWLIFLGGIALGMPLGALAVLAFIEWCQQRLSEFINHTPKG